MRKLSCIILLFLLLTANVGQAQFNDSEPMFGQMLNLGHWSTDGLVFYWRGIPAGNVVDESYYTNPGTITGATWVGDGLSFVPANNDFVLMDNVIEPTAVVGTVIVRFRADTLHTGTLFHTADSSTGNTYSILMRVGAGGVGEVLMRIDNTNWAVIQDTDNAIYAAGEWVTVAVVQDGNGYVYYANGIPQAMSDAFGQTSIDLTAWNGTFAGLDRTRIGREADSTDGNTFDGVISNVSSYSRALSASEIEQLYLNPALPMQQDPIWLFYSPTVDGIIPIIQAHARRRRAG